MIGFYNYTVWLTYIGMLSSVVGIGFAGSGNITAAVICLMFSGLCDMFDGIVARTKKDRTDEERRYGIQLDSLSDVVCFGVLPVAIGYSIGADAWWQVAIMALFALAGLIRLAYYNVTEETRQQQTTEKRKHYLGVPITTSALTVPLLFCFRGLLGAYFALAYTLLLLVNGAFFITPIQVKKPSKTGLAVMLVLGVIFTACILIF
ncbi:MAG: CDP-alcohol phosphatidyltransferase family protein [Oscillospiraceae bacterium]|nr:CDP-alcohol phosphatidyltransferase family protein [Oscillospiraceae bacterium]